MNDEQFLQRVRSGLREAGLDASIVVRDLDDGHELALEPDRVWPVASVAKLALAVAVLELVERGAIDAGRPVHLDPRGAGVSAGTDRFRFPATIALDDLVSLSLIISDNRASDALLEIVRPEAIRAELAALGLDGIEVRHPFAELARTPLERFDGRDGHLAHTLAIQGGTPASGHPMAQLDTARTTTATAYALVELLAAIWCGDRIRPAVALRMRELLGASVIRHRLAPDLASDAAHWSSKTGTLMNLRHEAGVLEHDDGGRFAIVVLSRSEVAASIQPAAESALGAAARAVHDRLRG